MFRRRQMGQERAVTCERAASRLDNLVAWLL